MLTAEQKKLLKEAIAKLEDADALVQEALGDTDVCYMTHNSIADIVLDLCTDLEDN
jgi:DNA-binding MarR family transcriptional regulator